MSLTVENWTSRLKPSSAKTAQIHIGLFEKWLREKGGPFKDYTPDMLVEYQKTHEDNGHKFQILDLIQRHISDMKGQRRNSKLNRYNYLRSLFLHNRAELPRDRSFHIRGDVQGVNGDLSPDEVRKIVLSCNPEFQAVFLSMLQGGMGSHEVLYWSGHGLEKLRKDLKTGLDILKIDLPGRKAGENERPFYTFLGPDAVSAVRKWLAERDMKLAKNGLEDAEAIFVNVATGRALGYFTLQDYWRRHSRRLGIGPRDLAVSSGRSGKSPHELRDVFRTQWFKSDAKPDVGEFLMGHVTDPYQYDKSWRDTRFYEGEYRKALPYLQILSSGKPFHQVDEEEIEGLRGKVEDLERQLASRSESDAVMDRLFKDERFVATLKERLRELKT